MTHLNINTVKNLLSVILGIILIVITVFSILFWIPSAPFDDKVNISNNIYFANNESSLIFGLDGYGQSINFISGYDDTLYFSNSQDHIFSKSKNEIIHSSVSYLQRIDNEPITRIINFFKTALTRTIEWNGIGSNGITLKYKGVASGKHKFTLYRTVTDIKQPVVSIGETVVFSKDTIIFNENKEILSFLSDEQKPIVNRFCSDCQNRIPESSEKTLTVYTPTHYIYAFSTITNILTVINTEEYEKIIFNIQYNSLELVRHLNRTENYITTTQYYDLFPSINSYSQISKSWL